MIIFFFGIVIVMLFNCANGLIMYAYYHDCDPIEARFVANHEKLIPRFVEDVAGHIPGMVGIFAASMISASLTIVSSALHSVSGILYNDFIRPSKLFGDAKANLTMQTIVFLFGVYCIIGGVLVERYHSIFHILNTIIGMTTGAKFGVFTMGLFWRSTNINVSIRPIQWKRMILFIILLLNRWTWTLYMNPATMMILMMGIFYLF